MAGIEVRPSQRLSTVPLMQGLFSFSMRKQTPPMHRIFRTLHLRDLRARMNFKNLREYLAWLYYQYLLITGIYVLEPWEKSIFNSILFSAIAMVVYTSYVFVPIHVRLALEFFLGIFGGQPESTMALMT
ncbi:serine palmitoyltransferase small subunit B isoform X1 [Pundamilia nyererei]|uniref:Serine palmitoyltransferase small subunit B n=7 Tax=Pseudocrenilabrinae TaxID=318546 RepID=A0A9Y3RLP7_9CICH|nr:PREDICTED: serine palmitoyltransferase small subunit B isoform X1 [Pundamilia nyererei]